MGGFISSDQLSEVYGLDTAVIHELKKKTFINENFKPKVLEINTATEKEFAAHPYIKFALGESYYRLSLSTREF